MLQMSHNHLTQVGVLGILKGVHKSSSGQLDTLNLEVRSEQNVIYNNTSMCNMLYSKAPNEYKYAAIIVFNFSWSFCHNEDF